MKCEQCPREIPEGTRFCSYECAIYAGEFSVRTGWKNPKKQEEKNDSTE